jgi:8-oxo-dGTP diphosphatase
LKQAVGIIITNENNEILLLQRGPASRSEHGKWESTGGALEENETPEETCKREIMEELGVELLSLTELFIDEDPEGNWRVYVFEGKIQGDPKIMEPEHCSGIQWVKRSELSSIDLTSYSRRDFERLGWI